jgi:hypothetical protein
VRGEAEPVVRWSDEFFQCLVRLALLRYLAVAHFGRGRGDYQEGEHPEYWQSAVSEAVEARKAEIRAVWERGKAADPAVLTPSLTAILSDAAGELLVRFYPEARELFSGGAAKTEIVSATAGAAEERQ